MVRRARSVVARALVGAGSAGVLGLCMGLTAAGAVRAETVILEPVQDASLFEDAEGDVASGSGPVVFAGNNRTLIKRRGLLLFDVTGAVPAGATIDAVELRLHVESAPVQDTVMIAVHRVAASWGEGASASAGGAGAAAQPGDATWLDRFYPDTPWNTPGGDFATTVLAESEVGPEGEHVWTGSELIAEVQRWLDEPAGNFGWLLQGNEDGSQTVRAFHSREAGTPALRPALVIAYTPEDVPVNPTTWSGLKRSRVHRFAGGL